MKYRKRILLLAVLALSAAFLFHHSVWAGKKISLVPKNITMFKGTGVTYQHGGGYLFCRDKAVMGWLFEHERN